MMSEKLSDDTDLKTKHRQLSSFIKSVHFNLRQKVKHSENTEEAWTDHCRNTELLSQYANAMYQLATDVWPQANQHTRIDWCRDTCRDYFTGGGLQRVRDKAERRRAYRTTRGQRENSPPTETDETESSILLPVLSPLRLLDVGSCYNAFETFQDEFLTIAIDISPATQTTFKCDFLNVNITDALPSEAAIESYINTLRSTIDRHSEVLKQLTADSFHVVVFCLLLEYLPTSEQRVLCCQRAWRLLAIDGLLLIITPDSRRQHRNHRVASVWTSTIEMIGFTRWRYEKLEHLHCLAFRKNGGRTEPRQPTAPDTALLIPQDETTTAPETMLPLPRDVNAEQSAMISELYSSELPFDVCENL